MGITMLLITKQSCCILLGIQTRTQLLVPLEIACTCTMLSHITQQTKKKRIFSALDSVFLGSFWWELLYTSSSLIT
ncbi:hypothetical protein N665_1813s0011 [Sinapis alba]|nr:hypothetical protein N665_1813s0011 [Sinapis alba]